MTRSVPLWAVLFISLVGALLAVSFAWAVKSTLEGSTRLGSVGRAAVEVANFPSLVRQTVVQLRDQATGRYEDEFIRVQRDTNADYHDFRALPADPGIPVAGLLMRGDSNAVKAGWRLLVGAFQLDGKVQNAALLVSQDLRVIRAWILDEIEAGDLEPRPRYRKSPHGVEVLKDGSLIFTFDGGMSIQRFNSCGERVWATGGHFHHAVTLNDDGASVWTLMDSDAIARVSVADGNVVQRITMEEVIAANPMIDILEIRRQHQNDLGSNSRNTVGAWLGDYLHFNDVDPLPARIADRFPGFAPGDLLVSSRSLNLIFVLDPASLEIKWWRAGAVQRQHDPDWLANGNIMVLNNRMSRDFSDIVTINPETFSTSVLFDGRVNDFYTRIRGKSQMLEDGTLVITSPQQGRAFEIDGSGNVVFEVVNTKPGSDKDNYVISEMKWLRPDFFDQELPRCETSS